MYKLSPQPLKLFSTYFGIANSIVYLFMPQIILDHAERCSFIGKMIAAPMAQHVRVYVSSASMFASLLENVDDGVSVKLSILLREKEPGQIV